MRLRRLGVALVLWAIVLALPARPAIDREGYTRNPSLWDLFAPPVESAYRASVIKTLQHWTATGTSTSQTATLSTAVILANSAVVFGGYSDAQNTATSLTNHAYWSASCLPTSTTVITCASGSTSTHSYTGDMVEYYAGILTSSQTGTCSIAGGASTGTSALSPSINALKGSVWSLGYHAVETTGYIDAIARVNFTTPGGSSSTVTCTRGGSTSGAATTVAWQAVEFK